MAVRRSPGTTLARMVVSFRCTSMKHDSPGRHVAMAWRACACVRMGWLLIRSRRSPAWSPACWAGVLGSTC